MRDTINELSSNEALRYVGATLLGFLLAMIAQWLSSHFERRRLASAIREALVDELLSNLGTLDEVVNCFSENRKSNLPKWPAARFRTDLLERCLDSSFISAITKQEQIQASTAFDQARHMNNQLETGRAELANVLNNPAALGSRQNRIERNLPVLGQTLMNLLLHVFEQKQIFASTRSAGAVHKIVPLFEDNWFQAERTWRTSSVSGVKPDSRHYVAWRNDAPKNIPVGVNLIELAAEPGPNGVFRPGEEKRFRGPWGYLDRLWRLRRLRQSMKELSDEEETSV